MDMVLKASRERAWLRLQQAIEELEHTIDAFERTRYPGRSRIDSTVISLRRDNLANALKQLGDIRRRVYARHIEALREDIADVMYLGRRAALNIAYFNETFAQSFAILEVAEAELLYEVPHGIVVPQLIISVSDALLAALAKSPRLLFQVSPRQFEEIVADLFRKEGFDVELTQATHDGGTDIIAVTQRMNIWQKVIVECKRYAPENRVGIGVVQRALGVKDLTHANKAVVVTTSSFSREAQAVARERFWELDLKAYADVVAWLRAAAPY